MKTNNPTPDQPNALTVNEVKAIFQVEPSVIKTLVNNEIPAKTHAAKLQTAVQSFHFSMFTAYKSFLKRGAQNSWSPLVGERYFSSYLFNS